jgi:predicted DNA-binding transcriptional regulator AlpA
MNERLSSEQSTAHYFTAPQVRARYGNKTEQCLWRWLRDGVFPQPDLRIKSRRYWLESTLIAWERRVPRRSGGGSDR